MTAALRPGPDAIDDRLARFPATSLARLGNASLLDRIDTKYLVPAHAVPDLLDACAGEYLALEVGGWRRFRYRTRYFDTSDLSAYRAHITGHLPRHKVRIRHYVDAGTQVLELKRRSPGGRTQKLRWHPPGGGEALLAPLASAEFRTAGAPDPASLGPVATISYRRVTLVHATAAERVTVDLDYACEAGGGTLALPAWAFVEVKQARRVRTPMVEALRALRLREISVSKYCLGIAALCPGVPRHGYRRLLDRLASALPDPAPATND